MCLLICILFLQHIVRKGENLYVIGKKYSVDGIEICHYNNLPDCNKLSIGQVLEIPESSTSSNYITYIVVSGDTLNKIANRYQVDVDTIVSLNNIADANKIYVGQELEIPINQMQTSVKSVVSNGQTYTVVSGDTLSKLASRFSTTVQKLKELNNIKDENIIYVGQILKLPSDASVVTTNPVSDTNKKTPENLDQREDLPSTSLSSDIVGITLRQIFGNEGKCQNNHNDKGNSMMVNGKNLYGYTCCGVTPSVGYNGKDKYFSYAISSCNNVSPELFVKCAFDLDNEQFIEGTKNLYTDDYFYMCKDFQQPLHYVCSDISVNSGPGRAISFIKSLSDCDKDPK